MTNNNNKSRNLKQLTLLGERKGYNGERSKDEV